MKKQPRPILTAPTNAEIWTLDEVAAYLRLNERTIFRRIKDGKLPAVKFGGSWRFRRDVVMGLMNGERR